MAIKITRVGRNGLQLTRLGLVNCFLVREDDGYTLIDANLKGSEQDILRAAGETAIKRLILTHPHVDHVGSVDALMSANSGLVLGASERSIPLLQQPPDKSLRPGEVGPCRGGLPGIQSKLNLIISEGDRVGSLLAISTPGHIHGHLAYLDERDGTLYAGDELFGMSHLGITGWSPWWFPLKAYSNRAQARQTAIKLLDYPIERFATGHGPVHDGGKYALTKAIALAKD